MADPIVFGGNVEWSGENPGISLKTDPNGPFVTLASFFRVVLSPHGRGHALTGNARTHQRFEEKPAIGAAEERIGGALGMRHQAEDVAGGTDQAGDIVLRAVRVG